MKLINRLGDIQETDLKIPKNSLSQPTIANGMRIFFGIAGAVAILIIAIGAFRYVISRGDAGAIKKSKETILYAAAGLVVTMAAYGIVTYVVNNI